MQITSVTLGSFLGSVLVRVIQLLLAIVTSGLLGSCNIEIGGSDYSPGQRVGNLSPSGVAERNRDRLGSLKIGMSPREAVGVMGEGVLGRGSNALANPHKSSAVELSDGSVLEVLFFYTEPREEDGFVGDNELTPLFFEDGQLRGWGHVGMRAYLADRVGLELELPEGLSPLSRELESHGSAVSTASD